MGSGTASAPLERVEAPERVRREPRLVDVRAEESGHGTTLTVVSGDRVGLIADVAGALALQRLTVRSARAWPQDELGVSVWEVAETGLDVAMVRQSVEAVAAGRVDPASRVRGWAGAGGLEPAVQVRHDVSEAATVLEVRVGDRPGLVHTVCRTLAGLGLSVRSAHVSTLGPQAVDVFYVAEPAAAALSDERAAEAAHAVRGALSPTVTLEH